MEIVNILLVLFSFGIGSGIGYFMRQSIARQSLTSFEARAERALSDSQKKSQEILLEAKSKAVAILEDAKKRELEREEQIHHTEKRLERREETLDRKMNEFEEGKKLLATKADEVRAIRREVEQLKVDELGRLEKIAALTQDQAKDVLLKVVEDNNRDTLAERMAHLEKDCQEQLEQKANNIMTQVIQKYARSHASEVMTTIVTIPSDDVKGKIIGKEGRNIRALEKLTGVEIIIDDTPNSIVVSGFDPIRRETARIALENLLEDGRIHPTRIEEAVLFAEKEIDNRVREAGEAAAYEVGIVGLDPKLLYILGRLRYRTSYKQNVLIHSLEVAYIAGALAAELGADVKIAKMAGLLHDIGKAVSHEVTGTHVNIGIKILEKFGIDKKVILGMRSHHEEYPYATPEAFIVTAADAISAGRPGARKDTVENYLKRLEELESLVNSFDSVEKCYAIQAGREIRVFVRPESIDDLGAMKLAKDIANRIESELKYPGEIKVNVFRETRSVEYAR